MSRLARLIFCLALLWLASPAIADLTHGLLDEIEQAKPSATQPDHWHAPGHADRGVGSLIIFFAPALAVSAAVGVCGGILGTLVIRRGEAMLALALPQAVAVGAALAMRMGWPEMPLALVAAALALWLFAREKFQGFSRGVVTTIVPALYVSGLCLSFLIIAHGGQHVEELQNLFTGIDVAVTPSEAWFAVPVLLLVAAVTSVLWRRWLLIAQMPAPAELAGIAVTRWHAAFLSALAVYVLLGTATQGVVMVLAMLFLPVSVVTGWFGRLPTMMLAAAAVSVVMTAGGFVLSNAFAWPLSHSVGGIGFGLICLSRCAGSLKPS